MSEYAAVKTKFELELLDSEEVLQGYLHGLDCEWEPGSDKSKSFWHGWRNAQSDRGRKEIDSAQRQLAREVIGTYKGLN